MSAGNDLFGRALPTIRTAIPGPESRRHAARLSRVESRNITRLWPLPPIFWAAAAGANVEDVDGNIFIDLTAGFGVATAGHANPAVTAAIAEQARKLPHGLGDVHPSQIKVELLEAFGEIAPAALRVGILGSAGAEAVEAALKTALLRTARAGVLAFECSYHGLTYGALATTHRIEFRAPFLAQLFDGVQFAPFPTRAVDLASALSVVDEILEKSSPQIGAILVEPIQGRGGIRMPCDGFLAALRERCDGETRVLIFDEIYTGMGRTGHWFACEHWGVVPDILVAGKGLSGSLPLSVALGTEEVMSAWPESTGEAIHTSTFLGNPIACAAALAQINEIRSKALLDRAKAIGRILGERLAEWPSRYSIVQDIRGRGALLGIELRISDTPLALVVANGALERGLIVLAEGISAEVIALTPPLVITDEQLGFALDVVEETIARCASA